MINGPPPTGDQVERGWMMGPLERAAEAISLHEDRGDEPDEINTVTPTLLGHEADEKIDKLREEREDR